MRAFIAIDLPDHIKKKISAAIQTLKTIGLDAKWVKPGDLHLTLKFLGNIEKNNLESIRENIDEVASNLKTFPAYLDNFDFFPNERKPRVFFVKVAARGLLESIAKSLEERLEKIGFKKEGRFKPHVTLARIKSIKDIDNLKSKISSIALKESFYIKEIVLIKSTLTSCGPIYENIFKSSLTA
jgi:2'-5' RNA ligase